LAPIIYIAVIYVPFHNTEMRYSMPAVPFLLALAVYFAHDCLLGAKQRRQPPDESRNPISNENFALKFR
jgi:hypothetical protein